MSSDVQPPEGKAKEVATIKEPGARLRQLREDAGIDLNAISAITLVPVTKLVALENGDLEKVGGSAYVTGYARNYARALKVDPLPIIKSFEALLGDEDIPIADSGAFGDRIEPQKRAMSSVVWGSLIVVVILLGVVAFLMLSGSQEPTSEPSLQSTREISTESAAADAQTVSSSITSPSLEAGISPNESASEEPIAEMNAGVVLSDSMETEFQVELKSVDQEHTADIQPDNFNQDIDEPVESPTLSQGNSDLSESNEPSADNPLGDDLLILNFSGDCWVEVRDANGDRKIAQLARSGDNLQLFGQAPFDIMMGNVRAVEILLNGSTVPLNPRVGRDTLRVQVGSRR